MFSFEFEYKIYEKDKIKFSDKEIKNMISAYIYFIDDNEIDDINIFYDFLSEYLFDELPCYFGDITENNNIKEFYSFIKSKINELS